MTIGLVSGDAHVCLLPLRSNLTCVPTFDTRNCSGNGNQLILCRTLRVRAARCGSSFSVALVSERSRGTASRSALSRPAHKPVEPCADGSAGAAQAGTEAWKKLRPDSSHARCSKVPDVWGSGNARAWRCATRAPPGRPEPSAGKRMVIPHARRFRERSCSARLSHRSERPSLKRLQ